MAAVRGASKRDPGSNRAEQSGYYAHRRRIMEMGDDPVDLSSPFKVRHRADMYFEACDQDGCKPTLPGLALAMGYDYPEMMRNPSGEMLRTYRSMEDIIAQMVEDGRIPMAPGIFLLKNWYGYRDTSAVRQVMDRQRPTAKEVKAKYADVKSIGSGSGKGRRG